MKLKSIAMVAGAALLTMGLAGNAAADQALYTAKLCGTCHGMDAKSPIMPTYPKLAGQNSAYCQVQVKDIRDGKRTNGLTAAMKPMVAALTDAEVTTLCDYIAGL